MNTENTRSSLHFWAPAGVAGTVATAAVALLLSAVATAPAYSTPTEQRRIEQGAGAGATGTPETVTAYCYMGRHTVSARLEPRSCGR